MPMQLEIGLNAISSYKRLNYTPWHAIAEFVDNSTQSYIDNRDALDASFKTEGEHGLEVSVSYDADRGGLLRVVDNAMGMSYADLERAMRIAAPPPNPSGRCKYGMGLKTAACWIGNSWSIETKRLGDRNAYRVHVDVESVAQGDPNLQFTQSEEDPQKHYTIIGIASHNTLFRGRTLTKIKDFLRSMYREDLRDGMLRLLWRGHQLSWDDYDAKLLRAADGMVYKKFFEFDVDSKLVKGWVGILARGSRAEAGFSILQNGRVIRGWPDSWRPSSLYGQFQGSNDLVNQRLVGEVSLNDFQVSHTKDGIIWFGDEEDQVEQGLHKHCAVYRQVALRHRPTQADARGPSATETDAAVDELNRELAAPEMIDQVLLEDVPPPEVVSATIESVLKNTRGMRPTLSAQLRDVSVTLYLAAITENDPYLTIDSTQNKGVLVIVNTRHPHWSQLEGSAGVLNYLRHCLYDGVAEWKAGQRVAPIDPGTIKLIKDSLLRVAFEVEVHGLQPEPTAAEV